MCISGDQNTLIVALTEQIQMSAVQIIAYRTIDTLERSEQQRVSLD